MENFNESSNQFGQQLFFLYFSHKRSVVAHANSLFPFENCCVYNWNCSTYQRPTSFEGALFAAETGSAASNQFENVALTKCGASALSRYTPVDKTPIEWPIPIKVRAIGQLLALETFWKKKENCRPLRSNTTRLFCLSILVLRRFFSKKIKYRFPSNVERLLTRSKPIFLGGKNGGIFIHWGRYLVKYGR